MPVENSCHSWCKEKRVNPNTPYFFERNLFYEESNDIWSDALYGSLMAQQAEPLVFREKMHDFVMLTKTAELWILSFNLPTALHVPSVS